MMNNTTIPTRHQSKSWLAVSIAGLALAGGHAYGQIIDVNLSNPLPFPGQSTVLTFTAGYGDGDYAVAGIATDIIVNEIQGVLTDLALIAPMDGPGTSPGVLSPDGVTGILAGQLNFPPVPIYADPTNPIAFFTMTFTVADDLGASPVLLDLETRTSRFDVYIDRGSSRSESRLDDLIEGSALIVVPAPAGALILGMGALAIGRRRRSS